MIVMMLLVLTALGQQDHRFLNTSGKITPEQTKAVVLAIEDEMYDNGLEEDYIGAGENEATARGKWVSRMPVYVDPFLNDGTGHVIYDFKHYGEIYRAFYVHDDGLVALDGDPWNEFPPTEPSLKTQYMSRTKVAQLKRDWLKEFFVIDTSTDERSHFVRDAAARQVQRTGSSYWQCCISPHLSQK